MEDEEEEVFDLPLPSNQSLIGEGEILIFNVPEFAEATGSIAASVRNYELFVLKKESGRWENAETPKKARLTTVKKPET